MIVSTLFVPASGMQYQYQPIHECPVCGFPVYDVPPFNADCNSCTLWFALLLAGGVL